MIILNFFFILYSNFLKILAKIYIPYNCRAFIFYFFGKYLFKIKNLEEFKLSDYKNLQEFFIRTIKLKTIENSKNLVSPCEAKILYCGLNKDFSNKKIKQSFFDFNNILDNQELSKKYEAGSFIILYLAPYNYHRFHAPASGVISYLKHINGASFPVNPSFKINKVFSINERVVLEINDLVMVMVGASGVREIHISKNLNEAVNIGAELGYFGLGSTIVLFSKDETFNSLDLINKNFKVLENLIV